MKRFIGLSFAFLMLAAAASACASTKTVTQSAPAGLQSLSSTSSSPIPEADGTVDSPSPKPDPVDQAGATADNPIPYGNSADFKTWNVKVVGATWDADATLAHENQFNDKPKSGYHYVMVTVRTKNIGHKSSDPYFDLSFTIIGHDGRQYTEPSEVLPNDLVDAGNVPPSAFAEGNVVFLVKDAVKGVLYIEDSSSFSSTTTGFMALS